MTKSFEAIQSETQVSLNTVDNLKLFVSDVIHGRWDSVIKQLQYVSLPRAKLIDLHEHMIFELCEMKEIDTAKLLLTGMEGISYSTCFDHQFMSEEPERYAKLHRFVYSNLFDEMEAYGKGSRDQRRLVIANALREEVRVAPPARLITLIGQALKYQQEHGEQLTPSDVGKFDLFSGRTLTSFNEGLVLTQAAADSSFPSTMENVIKFGKKSHATCACFSPDGQYLVTGSVDGFVEVWEYMSRAKLNTNLQYQAEDRIMMHESPVLCISFNKTSEVLASASEDAVIKIWNIKTGECIRKIDSAHSKAISCISFSDDSSQILSASHDASIRIYGLQSGRVLKTFNGHQSFVNSAFFTSDMTKIVSASSDATIKVWDIKTMECQLTFFPDAKKASKTAHHAPIHSALPLPGGELQEIVICSASPIIHVNDLEGNLLKTITNNAANATDFVYCVPSVSGNYLYAVGEDHSLYVFDTQTTKLDHVLQLHKKSVLGIIHHPSQNLLASWSRDGTLKLWR